MCSVLNTPGWEEGNYHSHSNKIRPAWDSACSSEEGKLPRVTIRQPSHSLHCMGCVGMSVNFTAEIQGGMENTLTQHTSLELTINMITV